MKVKIKDNHLYYNGKRYFTAGAEDVGLGTYGLKKGGLNASRLEPIDDLPIEETVKIKTSVFEIEDERKSDIDLAFHGNGIAMGLDNEGGFKFTRKKINNSQLRLIKLTIYQREVLKYLNGREDLLEELKFLPNNLRMVNSIFIVVTAEFSKQFNTEINASLNTVSGNLNAEGLVKSNSTRNQHVVLDADTCFAYQMIKPKWDKGQKKKRKKIRSFRVDMWGIG